MYVPGQQPGDAGPHRVEGGHDFDCVLLFNNAKPNWSTWTNVWFDGSRPADQDWVQWANASPNRTLVISQPMVPADAPADWRVLGARGTYDRYARQLAENLVAEGLGHSVIRLGWEANDGADAESALGTICRSIVIGPSTGLAS